MYLHRMAKDHMEAVFENVPISGKCVLPWNVGGKCERTLETVASVLSKIQSAHSFANASDSDASCLWVHPMNSSTNFNGFCRTKDPNWMELPVELVEWNERFNEIFSKIEGKPHFIILLKYPTGYQICAANSDMYPVSGGWVGRQVPTIRGFLETKETKLGSNRK